MHSASLFLRIALFVTLSIAVCFGANNMAQAGEATIEQPADNNNGDSKESNRNYYTFGVFPYLSPRDIAINYGPVSADFSQALKHEIRLRTTSSFEKFTENLNAGYYDIAFIQPFDFLPAVEHAHYVPLARLDEPLVTLFVVKKDSPLKTLNDLRGKHIALPPQPAANSRMGLKALMDAGLIPGKDVFVQYYPSQGSCVHEVLIGEAKTCATAAPIVKMFNERMNAHLRVLAKTEAIPHALYVAHERVPAEQREILQNLIISWRNTEHGQNLLHSLGFSGFTVAKFGDYKIMRNYSSIRSQLPQQPPQQSQAPTETQKDGLVFGVFPFLPPKRLAETFASLPAVFSRVTGEPVTFRTTSSYAKFTENLERHAYDIAMVQPFDYELALANDYVPFAQKRGELKAGFFVLKNSQVKSLSDLKGATIAVPPFGAALTRLALRELRLHKLIPGRNIEIQYRSTLDSCFLQLRAKLVGACASWAQIDILVNENQMRDIRLLQKTDGIPSPFFVVKKSLPESLRTRLTEEMVSWENTKEGRELLKNLRIGPFEKFNAAEYEALLQRWQEFQ